MCRKLLVLAALLVAPLLGSAPVWAMVCGQQGLTESTHTVFEHACYEYFFNNSGGTLQSGSPVVLDRTGTGVNVGITGSLTAVPTSAGRGNVDVNGSDGDVTNVGTYITTTATADLETVIGVVDDDSCADQSYCRVQVRGPRLVRGACGTSTITAGDAVATSTVSAQAGDAAANSDGILGVAISGCASAVDNSTFWAWINPISGE